MLAYQVGSWAREAQAFKEQVTLSLRTNTTDYLQEEATLFPPREALQDFFKDVDELSLRMERLKARFDESQVAS